MALFLRKCAIVDGFNLVRSLMPNQDAAWHDYLAILIVLQVFD